jgi:hypothetical protein
MTQYILTTPWRWETWGAKDTYDPYSRLAGRPLNGSTGPYGTIAPFMTDIPRGLTLIVNGTSVEAVQTPSQDALAAATAYFLGGHEYVVNQDMANILIAAGYSGFLEPI